MTRRSTSGTAVRFGERTVKTSSSLQSTVALSSGESEHHALVRGAAAGLSTQSLLAEWGTSVKVSVLSESSAARGHVARRGLGKMRHTQTRFLWLQERVAAEHVAIEVAKGCDNVADVPSPWLRNSWSAI